ncbi:hypothetical protein Tco_0915498, partial [Tanacetum coccineum]
PGPISSGLVPNPPPAAPYVPPTNKELEIFFQPMFDEYFETSTVDRLVPLAPTAQAPVNPTGPLVSIPIDQEAPSGTEHSFEVNPFAVADPEPFVNVFALDHNSEASSSRLRFVMSSEFWSLFTMADTNINAPEVPVAADSLPTRLDEQILPRNKWVPVGKRNCFLDVERTQANPIFKIAVDILKNTNFFKAFTASSTIPSIYIQQFWDTIRFDKDKGYNFQLDEQRFYLTKSTLRDASKHKFHKRPGSPLHLPYEESALGYLKLSFKNTKRVRFGMAIPDTLISENIRSATYYPEYVAKVAKYQGYLAGEVEKKIKLVLDAAEAPSQVKRSKAGKVSKKSKLQSTLQLVDEFVDEGVPADEPRFGDEEVDMEPEPGKYQPLPEVQGKGKEKVDAIRTYCTLDHEESLSSLYVELGLTDSVIDLLMSISLKPAGSDPENLKLPTEGEVRLEEPASSAGTLSSMQNLDKELSFTNQFLAEKSQKMNPEKDQQ